MSTVEAIWRIADTWERISLVALLAAALMQTLFVVDYGKNRPWYRHFVGKALMSKSATLCAALWLTIVNTFWVYPFEEQISAGVMVAILAAITYQYVSLRRTPPQPEEETD